MYATSSPPSSPPLRKTRKVTVPVKLLPRNVDLLSNDTLPVETTPPQSPLTNSATSSPSTSSSSHILTPPPRKILTRRISSNLIESKGHAALAKELTTQIVSLQLCESTDTSSEIIPVDEANSQVTKLEDFLTTLGNKKTEDNTYDEAAMEAKAKWLEGFGDGESEKRRAWRKL